MDRQSFIGGSDAAAVLGLSRWSTPLQVWAIKTGQIPEPDISSKIAVKLGLKLEDTVADFFADETGKKVRRCNETLYHPQYPFLAANIDRRVVGEESILECKTASAWKAKEWQGEDIPQEYIIQCYHYLAVTGAKKAYIAVLIGNQDFQWKEIQRDEKLIKDMVKKEVDFWENFIVPKVMPAQIYCNDTETLYSLFPQEKEGSTVELGDDVDAMIESLQAQKQDCKTLEMYIEKQENEIKMMLKDAEIGLTPHHKISWKAQSRKNIDTKKLREEMPEIAGKYEREVSNRYFRISKNKEV